MHQQNWYLSYRVLQICCIFSWDWVVFVQLPSLSVRHSIYLIQSNKASINHIPISTPEAIHTQGWLDRRMNEQWYMVFLLKCQWLYFTHSFISRSVLSRHCFQMTVKCLTGRNDQERNDVLHYQWIDVNLYNDKRIKEDITAKHLLHTL